MTDDNTLLAKMLAIGAVVGLSQVLLSDDPVFSKRTLGKILSNAILAVAAGSALAFIPGINTVGLLGLSAAIATLGTEALAHLFKKYTDGKSD